MKFTRTTKTEKVEVISTTDGNVFFCKQHEYRDGVFYATTFEKHDDRCYSTFAERLRFYKDEKGMTRAIKRLKKSLNN